MIKFGFYTSVAYSLIPVYNKHIIIAWERDITLKNHNSSKQDKPHKKTIGKTKLYLFSQIGSTLLIYMILAFLCAMVLNILLTTITPPLFISGNYWFKLIYNILPYIFIFIILVILLGQKIGYINEIQKGIQIIESSNASYTIPMRGRDELSSIAKSINEMRQAIESEIESKEKIKHENHQLITSVSQNINTPLTSVIAYLELIRDSQEKNPINKSAFEAALENACQIKGLINNFFEHALDNNSEVSYDFKIYHGNKLVSQIIDEITFSLEEAGFKIVLENCIDRDFSLKVDLKQLRRIFDNLVSNILKYADPNKPIHLGLILNKNELCIIQRNKTKTNTKIPKKTSFDNNAIGLYTCEKIILRHQGRINYYQLNSLFKIEISLPIYE